MNDQRDLTIVLKSRFPLVVVATHEEARRPLDTALVAEELARTRPLSVVMAERVAELRAWAAGRTVPAA